MIKQRNLSNLINPIPFKSCLIQISLKTSIVASFIRIYSSSLLALYPSKIIDMNMFVMKKTHTTMKEMKYM